MRVLFLCICIACDTFAEAQKYAFLRCWGILKQEYEKAFPYLFEAVPRLLVCTLYWKSYRPFLAVLKSNFICIQSNHPHNQFYNFLLSDISTFKILHVVPLLLGFLTVMRIRDFVYRQLMLDVCI